jgi:Photosynthesis system II assembly factor YCF48
MASREEDKAMAGLLRKSLAADGGARAADGTEGGAGQDCPAPEILAAYFDHALDAQETARYDLHFSQCSRCREQMAAMARASGETGDDKKTASNWNWLRTPAWLIPTVSAFAVLVLIAGITLHQRKTAKVEVASEIAPAQPNAMPRPAPHEPASGSLRTVAPAAKAPAPPSPAATRLESARSSASPRAKTSEKDDVKEQAFHAQKKSADGARPPHTENAPTARATSPSPAAGASSSAASAAVAEAQPVTGLQTEAAVPSAPAALDVTTDSTAPASAAKPKSGAGQGATSAPRAPKSAAAPAAVNALSATGSTFSERSVREAAMARMQQAQMSSSLADFTVATPDAKVLWMFAAGGSVARSGDGGANWKIESLETSSRLLAGSAPTGKICWVVGEHSAIYRTTDGTTWTAVQPPAASDVGAFTKIEAKDDLIAMVTAVDGRKFSTTDGGKTWTLVK